METIIENSVQENATKSHLEKFKTTSFLAFNVSASILKCLKEKGTLTANDYTNALSILASKYGLKNSNLFVANDLI
jgi:hypothetical protein